LHSPLKIDKRSRQRTKLQEKNFVSPIFTEDKGMFMLILLFDISIPPNSQSHPMYKIEEFNFRHPKIVIIFTSEGNGWTRISIIW
jgi:hypothetical protein